MEWRKLLPASSTRRNRFVQPTGKASVPLSLSFSLDPRWQEHALRLVLVVFGIGLAVLAAPFLKNQMNLSVKRVLINGEFTYLNRDDIMAQVPVYKDDRLFDLDLDQVQATLEKTPWVYSARVTRQWPDTLSITLVEQKPIAVWNDNQVLNPYGEVFNRNGKPLDTYPQLSGMPGDEVSVMERFREFSQLLSPYGLKIVRLQQNEQRAWDVETENGIRLRLGATQALEKMQRFVFLYQEKLQNDKRAIASVDLRYNNGAAVAWKNATAPSPASATAVRKG